MRGTATGRVVTARSTGIIPAHAGTRNSRGLKRRHGRDHPRTCGEQTAKHPRKKLAVGSSPHMRGTGRERHGNSQWVGIIPAHAGNRLENGAKMGILVGLCQLYFSVASFPWSVEWPTFVFDGCFCTSQIPSTSTGIRRSLPNVRNS